MTEKWHFECSKHGAVDYPEMIRSEQGRIDWKCDKCEEFVRPVFEEVEE